MTTVIAYIPALHRGYLDFFKKYSGPRKSISRSRGEGKLYILGKEFIKEFPQMDRDIRALEPEEIKKLVESLDIFSEIDVLTDKNLREIVAGSEQIVMPDEDISRHFAKTYLANLIPSTSSGDKSSSRVEFVQVFLRWDKQISTKEFEVPPDRVISESELDRELMSAAAREAEKSPDWWRQIGGVVVRGGEITLAAHNKPLPSEYTLNTLGDPRSNFDAGENIELAKTIHAEAALIAEAAKRGIALDGTSLYITTFPCPVCAKSIAAAGIKKVYYRKGYSLLDAEDILRAYGVKIILIK